MIDFGYKELLCQDARLRPLVMHYQDMIEYPASSNVFFGLVTNILSQQLSNKVAAIFEERLIAKLKKKNPKPVDLLAIPIEELRSIGLSNAKANYIHNIAVFFQEHKLINKKLLTLSDSEAIELLVQIKGVGIWTVEMVLLFSMGRKDIFSTGDFALSTAITALYKIPTADKKKAKQKMLAISSKWSPYRTYASLYLWRWYGDKMPKLS